jgi:hypothetical protein
MARPRKLPVDRITRSYRKPGGTTGRPRVNRAPPKPLFSIGISPNPGPLHGVSGFPTTGVGGGFSSVRASNGINRMRVADPSMSRNSLSGTPGIGENVSPILSHNSSYTQSSNFGFWSPGGSSIGPGDVHSERGGAASHSGWTTPSSRASNDSFFSDYGDMLSPIRNRISSNPTTADMLRPTMYNANTSEPTLEQLLEFDADQYLAQAQHLPRNQVLQQQREPHRGSLLDEHAERGLYDNDLLLQAALDQLDLGHDAGRPHGDVATPIRPTRLSFWPTTPQTAQRQSQLQNNGTFNNGATIQFNPPSGQTGIPSMADRNTPAQITPGYTNPANHGMFGPVPTPGVDGSWTLNILPGQAAPTLATMAPAADIPVQLNGPGQLGNTAAFYSRPSGGNRPSGYRL